MQMKNELKNNDEQEESIISQRKIEPPAFSDTTQSVQSNFVVL